MSLEVKPPAEGDTDLPPVEGNGPGIGSHATPAESGRPPWEPPSGAPSLRRGLEILGLFSVRRPWLAIEEIADALGLSPPDAYAQVSAMRRMNFVRRGPGRRYGPGVGVPELGMAAVRAVGVARHTRAHLVELQRAVRCPVTLAMLDGTELLVVDRAVTPGAERIEMTIDFDRRLPVHATALGKVLLAYMPEHREHALVDAMTLQGLTPRTIVERRELLGELQLVRDSGIAIEDRERVPDRRCIAAPVRGAHRHVIAAVGLTMTDADTPLGELVERHRARLALAAGRLSAALEYAQVDWPEAL